MRSETHSFWQSADLRALLVTALCAGLAACGSSGSGSVDDDGDSAPIAPASDETSIAPEDPGTGTDRFRGTWRTSCRPTAAPSPNQSQTYRRAVFAYDGSRASFFFDDFDDRSCNGNASRSAGLIGTLEFGTTVIEDVFGV